MTDNPMSTKTPSSKKKRKRTSKPKGFSPVAAFPKGHRHFGSLRCHAWSPNNGRQCMGLAMVSKGLDKCRTHGGTTPRGWDLPQSKTLRYSKDMPTKLLADYGRALADEDNLALNSEIALNEAMLSDALRRFDTGESGQLLRQIRETYIEFREATAAKNKQAASRSFQRLDKLTMEGANVYGARREARVLIEQRRKLVEGEQKRRVAMSLMLSVNQAVALLGAVEGILRENIKDQKLLSRVGSALLELVDEGTFE